jgi:hypothetical protein
MEQTTINIALPNHSGAGDAIYALANVIGLIAWAADQPQSKDSTAQQLLFAAAKTIKATPDIHPDAGKLMAFLMEPCEPPRKRKRAKLHVVLPD